MKKCLSLLLAFGLCLWTGCAYQTPSESVDFFAMDTAMHIQVYGSGAEEAAATAEALIEELDHAFSIQNNDSTFARFNETGSAVLSAREEALITAALELADLTGGTFDPTVEPVVRLWGFYDDTQAVPDAQALTQALTQIGHDSLCVQDGTLQALKPGIRLDLGGIAKGYAADAAAEVLRQAGVQSAVLDLGGNVRVLGSHPIKGDWTVAVTDPAKPNQYRCVLTCRDTSIVTSGGYQRYFEEDGVHYHHILDPSTGYPADNDLASVTVVCEDGTAADALSTALFVMGAKNAADFWRAHTGLFEAILILKDGSMQVTAGLKEQVQSSTPFEVLIP